MLLLQLLVQLLGFCVLLHGRAPHVVHAAMQTGLAAQEQVDLVLLVQEQLLHLRWARETGTLCGSQCAKPPRQAASVVAGWRLLLVCMQTAQGLASSLSASPSLPCMSFTVSASRRALRAS